ncbi:MAG: LPXTG cell wall anchor domain-containing protein, partial [Clostridia bacterium]|nr:LPXTG cell wall anchor domain-containing protein [Clostridia bacterium]
TITNCDFIGNYTDISGGAVTAFVDTEVTFTGCNFLNNEAATHGGAICVADSFSKENPKPSKIFLYDCLMEGNKAMGEDQSNEHNSDPLAPGGGAIYLHEYCEATLGSGTILQKNYAKDSGGAVYVCFGGRLECDGAQILDNESGLDGGGVYVDGTNAYSGYDHSQIDFAPGPDDGYAEGGQFDFVQGIITGNLAGRNGGGVYIGGENEVIVNDEQHLYTGGKLYMTGGVITENKAQDMGGGVYVGSCDTASKLNPGGILQMVDGAIYLNIAGENGNTSTGADDAGADVYCEGEYAYISVVSANAITAYVRNRNMPFVPEEHHTLYFTNWYDDYSDQDPTYGKTENKIGTGVNTGRYTSSIEPDRMVYAPYTMDDEYNALILDYDLKPLPETGDTTPLALWVMLALCSAAGLLLLRRRHA